MYVARILYPVKVLGPGNRIGIWFDGCAHHCTGCSNPELWDSKDEYRTDLETVMNLIHSISDQYDIDGFTITGGDPFYQPDALKQIVDEISKISTDIICYTGYEYKQLKKEYAQILEKIAVLIDGKYIEELNNGAVLRGSDNQNVIILNSAFREKYEEYLNATKNEIQNFKTQNSMISVGIHRRDYEAGIREHANRKGFVEV